MKIINILFATLITFAMLSMVGCPPKQPAETPGPSGDGDPAAVQDDNGDADIDIDTDANGEADEDDETIVFEDEEGKVSWTADGETVTVVDESEGTTVVSSSEIPEGWPDDIPIMDGFEARSSMETHGGEAADNSLVLAVEGDAEVKDVIEFYENLPGWSKKDGGIVMMSDVFGQTILSKGDSTLSVQITKNDESTAIILIYLPEGD